MGAGIAAFSASFTEGGEAIAKGMRRDVYSGERDLEGQSEHINGNYNAKPKFRLPAGKYLVVAKRGKAEVSKEIKVTAGKLTETKFVMNAGLLAVSAVLTPGKDVLKKGMRWDVYSGSKNLDGKRKHFDGNYDARPSFTLPAGKYYVVSKNGSAVKTGEVEVMAGKRTEIQFDLNAGKVKLAARAKDGGALKKGLRWDVYSAKKNMEGKRKHIRGNYDAAPIFTLNAGNYLVVLKFGQTTRERKLIVKAGDGKQIDIVLE